MNFSYPQVVFQEVPDHISLALSISGCDLGCSGCHSTETWDKEFGSVLTDDVFITMLDKYKGMISNVLFYGGEWEPKRLVQLLDIAHKKGLCTTLYTGREAHEISAILLDRLTFIKTGKYIKKLGGLSSPQTNQRFYVVDNMIDITSSFFK